MPGLARCRLSCCSCSRRVPAAAVAACASSTDPRPDSSPRCLIRHHKKAGEAFGDQRRSTLSAISEAVRHLEVQMFGRHPRHHPASWVSATARSQRRHQKLVEESPSPVLSERTERSGSTRMLPSSSTKGVGYQGAGTVEFIFDASESCKFFFIEMNTRIQVEHPVTELCIGHRPDRRAAPCRNGRAVVVYHGRG